MANEFDLTPKSASPYASSAYAVPYIPAPPNGASPVTIGAFGASTPVAGAGDAISSLTPEKRLLIIINNVLEMEYDDIEEAKTKAKEAIPKMADSMLKDNFATLIDDYEKAEKAKDETAKKKALDTFEKNIGGNPSTSDPSTSSASTADVSLSPTLPGAPPFQSYPTSAMPMSTGAIPGSYPGMGNQFPNIPGAGTAFNPNPSQTAGTAGTTETSSTPAASSSSQQAEQKSAAAAPAVKTNYPNYEQIPIDEDALKSDKLKSSLDGVCGNIDGEGKYSFSADKTNEEKFRQVEDDIANADGAKEDTENYYKEQINNKGNALAEKYNSQRQEKIEKTYGNVYAGDPEKLDKPEGSVQTAQKSEFEKIFKAYGVPSAFEAAKNNTADATTKATQYVKNKEKTDRDLIGDGLNGGYNNVDLPKLQNKLNLATAVSNAVTPALASARKETEKSRKKLEDAKRILNSQNLPGGISKLTDQDTRRLEENVADAQKEFDEAKKEEERLKNILKYADEAKLQLQGKIIEETVKRNSALTAVTNGSNDAVKGALGKKQEEADEIKPKTDEILGAVKSGNPEGIEIAEGLVNNAGDLKAIVENMIQLKTKKADTLKSISDLKTKLESIINEKRYGKGDNAQSLRQLAENEKRKNEKSDSNEEEKVSIDGLPDTRKKFDALSGEFGNPSSAKPAVQSQFGARYLGQSPITGGGYTPGDLFNVTDTKPPDTGLDFPGGKF